MSTPYIVVTDEGATILERDLLSRFEGNRTQQAADGARQRERQKARSTEAMPTVTPQVEKVLSAIGTQTLSTKEIMCVIGLKDKSNFLELYLYPAIRQNLVEPIYPENPKHPRQKYRLTDKGKELLI